MPNDIENRTIKSITYVSSADSPAIDLGCECLLAIYVPTGATTGVYTLKVSDSFTGEYSTSNVSVTVDAANKWYSFLPAQTRGYQFIKITAAGSNSLQHKYISGNV